MPQNPIKEHIRAFGPIPLREYMRRCLQLYYERPHTLTASTTQPGDFVTAPEISSLFGEMIALWITMQWHTLGKPPAIAILELGPGRGTLMHDIISTLTKLSSAPPVFEIHLVENSNTLRHTQRHLLRGHNVHWHGTIEDARNTLHVPILCVANEFFDALPIDQYIYHDGAWRLCLVAYEDGTLKRIPAEEKTPLLQAPPAPNEGDVLEVATSGLSVLDSLSKAIMRHRGAALIIDYGYMDGCGDTLQSLSQHTMTHPFADPGAHDLTAHVNFGALQKSLPPLLTSSLSTQKAFLSRMGIFDRLRQFQHHLTPEAFAPLQEAVKRLTANTRPTDMGCLFKVLEITTPHPGSTP